MKRSDWPVVEGDNRPAGPPDRCFYCNQPLGSQHAEGCVIRSRTIVVRTIVEHVITCPEDWDVGMIEFAHNDGSSCASNDLDHLTRLNERLEAKGGCPCELVTVKYLREATAEDEAASGVDDTNIRHL